MSDFDKEKFRLDRIKPTIDISIGLFKGDPDTVAKGVLDKVKPIYEDIIKAQLNLSGFSLISFNSF